MPITYAKSTVSSTTRGGIIIKTNVGEVWDADDEFVLDHPNLFDTTPPRVRTQSGWVAPDVVVETATAAPGQKRKTKR